MNHSLFRSLLLALVLCTSSGAFAQDQPPASAPATRTGWSPQTKDAALGGAAGLLGGLLINGRNRKVGGLIGGLAGAGAGYVLGQHQANQRKAAAAAAAQQAAAAEQAAAEAQAAATPPPPADPAPAAPGPALASTPASTPAVATRLRAARAATARATAERAVAERRLAASQRAVDSQAHGTAPAVADLAVAAGYVPNPTFGQAGTAYSFSRVQRKSW